MFFLYNIPGKASSKRTSLLRVVATNVYLDKIWNFVVQYISGTKWKVELGTFPLQRVLATLGQVWKKVSKVINFRCY